MISIKEQENLFIEIGNKLPREIITYAIGGTAMMFLGFKEATKDIDLVFTDIKERTIFKEIAISLGYQETDSKIVYGARDNLPIIISLGDSRVDLFLIRVIDFIFSLNMQKRASKIYHFGKNLVLKIADEHDIIMMKCATNRTKDEEDIVNIVKNSKIDWSIPLEECKTQINLGRESAFMEMGNLVNKLIYKHKLDISNKIDDTFYDLLIKQIKQKEKDNKKKRSK